MRLSVLLLSILLAACGGGSESDSSAPAEVAPEVVAEAALEQALRTGDASLVQDADEFIVSALNSVESSKAEAQAARVELFNLNVDGTARADGTSLNGIYWHPSHDSALLLSTYGLNHEVLVTNAVFGTGYTVKNQPLAIAGQHALKNGRFIAFGGNPMRNDYKDATALNADMHQFLVNSISWLVGRRNFVERPLKLVLSHLSQSYYFPDEEATRNWLNNHYSGQVNYNTADTCDHGNLAGCLTDDVDILLISQDSSDNSLNGTTVTAVKNWLAAGKPVMYLHHDGDLTPLGQMLFALMDIGYDGDNYWRHLMLDNYNATTGFDYIPADIQLIVDLLKRFRDSSFSIDLSGCSDKSCPPESGLDSQFVLAADAAQSMLNRLDESKIRLFEQDSYTFQKSLLLLADSYRQHVAYPMDKTTTPLDDFLRSYFADHLIYNMRAINPAQPDMGNFSRSDFSHVTPVDKAVAMTSKPYFRAAGVYALPGQTFSITRTDSNAVITTVFINTLRSGATHEFNENGYTRPKYLKTVAYDIKPGETLELTSAYGGPIQIGFDANNVNVSFQFKHVGEHPFWQSPADNDFFAAAMNAGDYDWAELVTPNFEVHSKLDKMRESLVGPIWNDAEGLAAATERYVQNFPHVLAGYQGPGIDLVAEIHSFALLKGWQIDTLDIVKHMNADQANCGYGCSGNPYDAYWSFSPLDHGDLHEFGHGLERSRFRFNGWDGHASTNPYSYYSKSHYYQDTGNDPTCQSLPFPDLKTSLQASRTQPDPFAYMQAANLTGWSEGAAITIQMMMAAQGQGILTNGWHLLARLHMLDREFRRADDSDSEWDAKKSSLGFGTFTRQQALALDNNDWMTIALSYVLGRDMRNYLRMWGLGFSQQASDQVAEFSYSAMPLNFYDSSSTGYCFSLSQTAIPIN